MFRSQTSLRPLFFYRFSYPYLVNGDAGLHVKRLIILPRFWPNLNLIDKLQPKTPYLKFQEICTVNAEYFEADRQTAGQPAENMTKLKAVLRKVLRTYLNTTSPSHESLLTSRRHYRRTDIIQRRRVSVTSCPTYSLGLSIEVGRYECVRTCKNSLCHITGAIKMCCLVRDAHSTRHTAVVSTQVPSHLQRRHSWPDPPPQNKYFLSDESKSDKKYFPIGEAARCQA
jgi:hypothetical protein